MDVSLPLLVGVSVGPTAYVFRYASSAGYRPVVAHLDHGLRPEAMRAGGGQVQPD
jgi:hypothetical protein